MTTPKIYNRDKEVKDTVAIGTEVTQHAAELEQNMDKALETLSNQDEDDDNNDTKPDHLTPLIQHIFQEQLQQLFERLDIQHSKLKTNNELYEEQSQKLEALIETTKRLNEQAQIQYEKTELKLSFLQRKMCEFDEYINKMKTTIPTIGAKDTPPQSSVATLENKMNRLLNRLKETTTKMLEQQDNDNEMIYGRLLHVEDSIKQIKVNIKHSSHAQVPRTLFPDDSTENENLIQTELPPANMKSSHFSPPQSNQHFVQTTGPNMEYLRKNVNMTCADQEQILEFYTKLRLAVAKGGIFLTPIEKITKTESIAERVYNASDYDAQSNAHFTLLSNEKFIPNDFVMA